MWRVLSLALALCLLADSRAESEPDAVRCKGPAEWTVGEATPLRDSVGRVTVVAFLQASCLFCLVQASRLDNLRLKLEGLGYENITYMVVNSQEEGSRRLHSLLELRLSEHIQLYGQQPDQPDVWKIANVEKDDFQIFDRCGRLTYHLSLPYTILGQPYVEEAIRNTYCNGICGECENESPFSYKECNATSVEHPPEDRKPEEEIQQPASPDHHHGHHRRQHHGHQEHHHHHHHHHHGSTEGQSQHGQHDVGQAHVGQLDLGQVVHRVRVNPILEQP